LNAGISSLPDRVIASTALDLDLPLQSGLNLATLFVICFGLEEPALELSFAACTETLEFHDSVK
jgi:hypothetical protein